MLCYLKNSSRGHSYTYHRNKYCTSISIKIVRKKLYFVCYRTLRLMKLPSTVDFVLACYRYVQHPPWAYKRGAQTAGIQQCRLRFCSLFRYIRRKSLAETADFFFLFFVIPSRCTDCKEILCLKIKAKNMSRRVPIELRIQFGKLRHNATP